MVWSGLESALSRHDETNIENPPSAFAPGGFLQNAREGSVTWITRPLLRRKATGQNWPESRRARFCGLPRLEPRGQGTAASVQFAARPASLTAVAHSLRSAAIMAANCAGVLPIGSTPNPFSFSTKVRSLVIRPVSAAMRSTIGCGVPAGAIKPHHEVVSNPAKPDSAIVGTLGACADRAAPVTANIRTVPAWAFARASPNSVNIAGRD